MHMDRWCCIVSERVSHVPDEKLLSGREGMGKGL
jgi:hypothetical protein